MQPPQYSYPYPPPPPPPPPEYRPAQPKRSAWQRFRALGCGRQSLIGCLTLFLLGCGFLCVLGAPAFMQGVHSGLATSTAESRATTTALTPTQAALITHRRPRMGGPLSDFVGKFGQPVKILPDNEQFTANKVQITAYVNGSAIVDRVFIAGPFTWTGVDTQSFCDPFLPDDAQEYASAVGNRVWIDYHSSLGEIVQQFQTPTCLLFVSPS